MGAASALLTGLYCSDWPLPQQDVMSLSNWLSESGV